MTRQAIATRAVERPAIRYGSLCTPPAPMSEARRIHIFGKIVPADIRDLDRARKLIGEPGLGYGTLVVAASVSAIVVVLTVAAVMWGAG